MITLERDTVRPVILESMNDRDDRVEDTICIGRAEYEHLKEQLALAREEIKSLKADAEEADRRADSLKTYYEGIIRDYRKYGDEADKRLEKALARIKSLNECLKKVVEMI